VSDLVGGVAFLDETALRVVVTRELRVKDLDRGTAAVVLVRRREHGAHTATRDLAIDSPFVPKDATDPARLLERLLQ
jgi:hypothetical protein